jgi:hypothetical protein
MRLGRILPSIFVIVSVLLVVVAFFRPGAAGLGFDILGVLLLLYGEMKTEAAMERYKAKTSREHHLHVRERKKLPWHQRFPLHLLSRVASKDLMALSQQPVEESLPRTFWGLLFLVVGFALQLIGSLQTSTP